MKSMAAKYAPILAALILVLNACTAGTPTVINTPEPVTLKLALIPVLERLPIYVAQQEGLFQAHGVNIQIIPVASAGERDTLIASGQADGMINEALSTMLYNKDQVQVQIVRYSRAATKDSPLFRIIASKQSGITSVEGLKGVEIGISNGTVIEYLTYRLLEAEGLSGEQIKTVAIPGIPDRMALLNSGGLNAGVLPDPSASVAMQQGGVSVLDDTRHPEYSFSTLTFRKAVIDQHPEAIRAFLAAIEEAVNKINSNPDQYKDLLVKEKLLPVAIESTFYVPQFVTAGIPTQAQWDDQLAWAKQKGLLNKDVPYQDSVTGEYLPKK